MFSLIEKLKIGATTKTEINQMIRSFDRDRDGKINKAGRKKINKKNLLK